MPPGDDGRTEYKTLDARCAACVMKEGDQQPCLSPGQLAAEEAESGYPCPRREWESDDQPLAWHLARLGAHGESGHLFRLMFDVSFGESSRAEKERVLGWILRAYEDEVIAAALWPTEVTPPASQPSASTRLPPGR